MSHKNFRPNHLELMSHKGREPIQPPRLLGHIRKNTLASCEQLMAHLFSATDDLFYDLSKRASSNSEQNLYFEAMREIRIKREGIANEFLRSLANLFSTLVEFQDFPDLDEEEDPSALAIVEGDDLEVDLARSNMVNRTRDIYREELYELSTRLDHLLLQVEITEDNNPLDPQQLSDIFIDACQNKLEVNIKAKLILYKLFEKHVLKQLGHIYADANQTLLDAGILPKVPKMHGNRVVHGGVAGGGAHTGGGDQGQPAGEAMAPSFAPAYAPQYSNFQMGYDALNLLMAAARGGVSPPAGHPVAPIQGNGQAINCFFYSANPGPVMAAPELTNLLTHSQTNYHDQLVSATAPRNIIADVIQHLLAQRDPSSPQALEQNDENIINLVAMFFDQILADDSLPVAIQSVICRMQIPILKVALRDRSFFNNPEHPARKLINAITEAGMGFDDSKPIDRDPLYKKIVDIVHTLNRQYKADDRIFSELEAELEKAIAREKRKAAMVEQRTTQTEAGKSRIKQARTAAQGVMYQKLKDEQLPEAIKDFLTKHWLQVMVITHLKYGAESAEWVSKEQSISDLIWISHHHEDIRSRQRRERLLPELLDRIESDLAVAIDSPDLRAAKVNILEETLKAIHHLAETGEEPASEASQQTPAPKSGDDVFDFTPREAKPERPAADDEVFEAFDTNSSATPDEPAAEVSPGGQSTVEPPANEADTEADESENAFSDTSITAQNTVFSPLSEEQRDALGKGENAPKAWDEMTAVERQQARYEELSSRYFALAKEMPEGSWLEYFDEEAGKKLRCKLTSKIDADTYIFVNRFGFKVLEKTRKQFAYDMQFNRAKLLNTNPTFDRIMGSVVENLNQVQDHAEHS